MDLYKKTFIIFTLLYLLFFVKTWGSITGFIYSHDDVVYYAQAASLANDFDIDIKNNLGPYNNLYLSRNPQTGRIMSYENLGPSLLYLVPYLVTKPLVYIISFVRGASFNEYDPLFFVSLCFVTLILFFYSGLFLLRIVTIFFERPIADICVIFTLWGTILPVYVFRRPIFSVIPEFFFTTILLYFMFVFYKEHKMSVRITIGLAILSGFLFITRWNDIYILPFCLLLLLNIVGMNSKKGTSFKIAGLYLFTFIITATMFFFLTQGIAWINTYGNVGNFLSFYIKKHWDYIHSVAQPRETFILIRNIKNFMHILFGLDWGVIFTMPILLLGGLAFIFGSIPIILTNKIIQRIMFLVTFILPFYVILQWKNTGEYYGYRFLISLLPFSALGFAALITRFWSNSRKLLKFLVFGFCILNFLVILPFELTEKTTLHAQNITPMGGCGWGNNSYFLNAVRFYFESDGKTLISNFLRGFLAAFVFGILSLLGINLSLFSPKVKAYFALGSYRSYIALVYFFLVLFWFFILKKVKLTD